MALQYQLAYTMQGLKYFALIVFGFAILFVVVPRILKSEKVKCIIKAVSLPMYFVSFAVLLIGVLLGYGGYYDRSMVVYMLSLCLTQCAILLLIFDCARVELKTVVQAVIISVWLFFWYISAFVSNLTIKEYPSFVYVGFVVVASNMLLWIKYTYLYRGQIVEKIRTRYTNREFVGIFALIAISIIMSVVFIWKLPFLWDAADYLVDLLLAARWEFTLGNVTKMDLFAHHCAGYVFLTLPGAWIFKDSFVGIHVIQTIILCVTIALFWGILRRKFDTISVAERTLITAAFFAYPAVFGLSSGYNLDFGLLCLIVWVVYAWVYELDILKFVFGFLMCTTKEPAVVLYAGMALGMYIYKLFKKGSKRFKIFTCMAVNDWFVLGFPIIWWLAIDRLVAVNANYVDKWNRAGFKWLGYLPQMEKVPHNFGISMRYVGIQLIHEFVMNFQWVVVIGIIGLGVYMFVNRKAEREKLDVKMLLPFACGIVLFTLFHCVYITHPHYRYVASIFALMLLIFVALLTACVTNRTVRISIYSVLTVLFLVQTFRCIDPFTIINGHKVNTGSSFVINYDTLFDNRNDYKISDYSLYNIQCNQYGGVLNKAFSDIDMEETLVMVADDGGDMMYSAMGGRTTEDGHALGYNYKTGMFSPVKDSEYTNCSLGILNEKTGEIDIRSDITDIMQFKNIYFINTAFSTISDVESVLKDSHFNILNKSTYSSFGGWNLEVYKLDCIDE